MSNLAFLYYNLWVIGGKVKNIEHRGIQFIPRRCRWFFENTLPFRCSTFCILFRAWLPLKCRKVKSLDRWNCWKRMRIKISQKAPRMFQYPHLMIDATTWSDFVTVWLYSPRVLQTILVIMLYTSTCSYFIEQAASRRLNQIYSFPIPGILVNYREWSSGIQYKVGKTSFFFLITWNMLWSH